MSVEDKGKKKGLESAKLGRLIVCRGNSKSELCSWRGQKRTHVLTIEARTSPYHRELVSALAAFAATNDEVDKEELRHMKRMKLAELRL